MATLSDEQIHSSLESLDGWGYDGSVVSKEFKRPSFGDAVSLVVRVAFVAEAADHHPDIDIRYNVVRFALATHSQGGVTARDIELAAEIELLCSPKAESR